MRHSRRSVLFLTIAVLVAVVPRVTVAEAVPSHLQEGWDLYQAGQARQARSFFERVQKEKPRDAWSAYYLGRLGLAAGDPEQAIERFELAIENEPGVSVFHHWRGLAYLEKLQNASVFRKLGLSKQVRASYLKAIELDPENFGARESLAGYYFEAPAIAGGSEEKGKAQVDAIRAGKPQLAHRVMGSHYFGKKEFDLAEREFKSAIEIDPEDPGARFALGLLYQSMERFADAFATFEKIVTLAPDDMKPVYQIGRTASLSGTNLDRGIECLKRYLDHRPKRGEPSLAWAHYRLGLVYGLKGDRAAERRGYEAAVRLDPEHEEARKALKKL